MGGIEEEELVWADVVDDEEEQGDDNIHSTLLTTNTDPGAWDYTAGGFKYAY